MKQQITKNPVGRPAKWSEIRLIDENGEITKYSSISEVAADLYCSPANITNAIRYKYKVRGYIIEADLAPKFIHTNIHNNNYGR